MSFRDFAAGVAADQRLRGLNVVILERVDSTNRYARDLLHRVSLEEGRMTLTATIVAYEQTAGRGRLGNRWDSRAGLGLYCSLVRPLPDDESPEKARSFVNTLPLLVGVSLCRALQPLTGSALPRLKWPNDVVVAGGKIAGVLIEVVGEKGAPQHAVIGVGLNWGHDRSALPTPQATSLRLVTEPRDLPDLASLLAAVISAIDAELAHAGDRRRAISEYRQHSGHREGETLRCRMAGRTLEGLFVGFDDLGHLRLRCGEEEVLISAGEVVEGAGSPS